MIMHEPVYISAILPLRLGWEPFYCYRPGSEGFETGLVPGDRIRVRFAGKEYIGTVYRTDAVPTVPAEKILEVISVEKSLCSATAEEIALWESVAEYYMCTIGEVYKAAYPALRKDGEEQVQESHEDIAEKIKGEVILSGHQEKAYGRIMESFAAGKPVLLQGETRSRGAGDWTQHSLSRP